jgi:hypothetical protein
MTKRITVPFEIVSWDETAWSDEDGVQASRAAVSKRFGGELSGTSLAELLIVKVDGDGVAYTAHEVVTGELEGRSGSFALAHGAIAGGGGGDGEAAPGRIVPGSGRGELAGIAGTVEFRHDEQGPRVTLAYDLA